MRHNRRRKWDVLWMAVIVVALAVGALVAAAFAEIERISGYWTSATIEESGSARIVEVIDYDFGLETRRGIFRDVPGLAPDAEVTVTATDAPDDTLLQDLGGITRIRIGNPDITITGRHRYTIEYGLDTVVSGDQVAWNAIGTEWGVPIGEVEIHLLAPFELGDLRCDQGGTGAFGGCSAEQVEPGHIVVEASGLDPQEGISIFATAGAALATSPSAPAPPVDAPADPGTGAGPPLLVAFIAAILGVVVTSRVVRRLGREEVYAGGAADAAFGPGPGATAPVRRVDAEELGEMATIEFEPPRDLSATAGGIVLRERVETRHKIAWLLECAIREEVELVGERDDLRLVRGPQPPHPAVAGTLDALFSGRNEIELGSYDAEFAAGWSQLDSTLDEWWEHSGLWHAEGHSRRTTAIAAGLVAALAGAAGVGIGAFLAAAYGAGWLVVVGLGALVAGAGLTAALRSWELLVRTAQGSAIWLRVESFRRFIANSEVRHAESAARMGLLRQYTAWAVALDELDHWTHAVEAAAADPTSSSNFSSRDMAFIALAPSFSSATASTFTAPSSSGGGGGGGGGVGGGGGGGGGGSW
jgi:hypothetical protein